MKVILYMATSLNGFIADEKGEEDFLLEENWKTFLELAKKHKCIVIGGNTYEVIKSWGKDYDIGKIKGFEKIVISLRKDIKLSEGYTLGNSIEEGIDIAKSFGVNSLILTGGSELNKGFVKKNLIDEIILNINPVLIGNGIKIFKEDDFEVKLKLMDVKKIKEEIVQLRYRVK